MRFEFRMFNDLYDREVSYAFDAVRKITDDEEKEEICKQFVRFMSAVGYDIEITD